MSVRFTYFVLVVLFYLQLSISYTYCHFYLWYSSAVIIRNPSDAAFTAILHTSILLLISQRTPLTAHFPFPHCFQSPVEVKKESPKLLWWEQTSRSDLYRRREHKVSGWKPSSGFVSKMRTRNQKLLSFKGPLRGWQAALWSPKPTAVPAWCEMDTCGPRACCICPQWLMITCAGLSTSCCPHEPLVVCQVVCIYDLGVNTSTSVCGTNGAHSV